MTMFNYKYNKTVAVLSHASTFRDANLHHWCTASEGWLLCSKQEITGSHCAGPNLDFHFKTCLEATSTPITIKSGWRRMYNNKNTSICGNEIIVSFHVSWPFCLVCGRSRFQIHARKQDVLSELWTLYQSRHDLLCWELLYTNYNSQPHLASS